MKINIKPISVNRIFHGRRFKTPEYKAWRRDAGLLMKNTRAKPVKGWVTVEFEWYIKAFNLSDEANFIKATCDALVDAGLIDDDRFIKWHRSEKFQTRKGEDDYFVVQIKPYTLSNKNRYEPN